MSRHPEPVPDSSGGVPEVRPYGSWPTPFTAERVLAAAVSLLELGVDGEDVYWTEGRPAEGGRIQLVRRLADGTTSDLLPGGFAARTAVHEYGGGSFWARDGVVWFANWSDQRLYRLADGGEPVPLTPEPAVPRGDRYADGHVSPDGATLAVVRERHPEGGRGAVDVRNEIVTLDPASPGEPVVLVTGPDFVAAPRFSPDGDRLAYLRWNHPSMPWDDTELVVRDLASGLETVVAGGPGEAVLQPRWDGDGRLLFLSDRTDRWNLYAWDGADTEPVVVADDAEIGFPGWVFAQSQHETAAGGRIAVVLRRDGTDRLAVREPDGSLRPLDLPFSEYALIRAYSDGIVAIAGSGTEEFGVHLIRLGGDHDGRVTSLRPPRDLGIDPAFVSLAEAISFSSGPAGEAGRTAHALFYPPSNPAFRGPDGALPPLLVVIHGGPTAAARPSLNLGLQFWTSRGFAVVDVNYGGSSGYGRAYRNLLRGAWGVVDVEDCLAAARWLADHGRVDPDRLCIRGGSAGGYTTLAALAREDTPFAAGADHFGVADLTALAADTHKFESRYLDGLVGPYPEAADVYRERSPISRIEQFHRPLIVLQGDEDAIVPPNQSEAIVQALRDKGVPVAYLLFSGEQHGFRKGENIRRAMEAELSFYAQVLGFPLPEDEGIEPVAVENLPA